MIFLHGNGNHLWVKSRFSGEKQNIARAVSSIVTEEFCEVVLLNLISFLGPTSVLNRI